ncbi:MAG: HAD family hydrolase [Caldilineaceae bacterium]|nr:HAD family hydrolase [Caldilineaceae bacterium]
MTMQARPFDLVILDLDGTILDPYKSAEFSPAVVEAVAAVQAAGIPVTIGTGRTFPHVCEYARKLAITTPVVTTQGAVVGDPVSGKVLAETLLPLTAARRAAEWFDQQARVTALYFTNDDGTVTIYQNLDGGDSEFYEHVFGAGRILRSAFAPLIAEHAPHLPVKFITIDNPDAGDNVEPTLRALLSDELYITRTHPLLVEGTAQGVHKGQGVLNMLAMLNIDPQRVMAIGDSDNDIPMLEAVGFAVAMGNASAGVRAVADWMAPSIAEDGAAVALRKFILDLA